MDAKTKIKINTMSHNLFYMLNRCVLKETKSIRHAERVN